MHGENVSIDCNKNYELEGNVTQITCNNGTFNKMPRCEPARCKTLPSPPNNGMVVVSRDIIPRNKKQSPAPGARGILSFKIPRPGVPGVFQKKIPHPPGDGVYSIYIIPVIKSVVLLYEAMHHSSK